MTLVSISSLILLILTIGAQHRARPFLVYLRWLTIFTVTGLTALLSYLSALQYFAWATGGAIARLLLPPHQSLRYFAFYSFTEFWANYLLAASIGFIGYLAIKRHAKQDDPFFYPEEPLLCFLAFLLVGHPFWILYTTTLLICAVIGTCISRYITKTNSRVSFRYLWLPLAIATLLLSPLLQKLDFVIYLQF
jgi:hypothetical protein